MQTLLINHNTETSKGLIMRKSTSYFSEEMHANAFAGLAKKHTNLPDGHDDEEYEPEDTYYSSDEEEEDSSSDSEPEFDNLDDFDDDFYDDDDDDF